MKYIIGDIGNTSIKICVLNHKFTTLQSFIFETNNIYKKDYLKILLKKFLNKETNHKILLSSVVPSILKEVKKNFKNTKYNIIEIKELNLKKIIKINIKNIKQLGSDRIANAIGARKFKDCLILDFGTATTFDIVKKGVYEGGVIAPGVKLSMQNLCSSTAMLPLFKLKNQQKSYGKNTKEALNAGFIWGYEGLINNIINKITSKWKMNYKIILTGGYANFFKKKIKKKSIVDKNITIKGITKVYKELL